jgi:hypothetical protein
MDLFCFLEFPANQAAALAHENLLSLCPCSRNSAGGQHLRDDHNDISWTTFASGQSSVMRLLCGNVPMKIYLI